MQECLRFWDEHLKERPPQEPQEEAAAATGVGGGGKSLTAYLRDVIQPAPQVLPACLLPDCTPTTRCLLACLPADQERRCVTVMALCRCQVSTWPGQWVRVQGWAATTRQQQQQEDGRLVLRLDGHSLSTGRGHTSGR